MLGIIISILVGALIGWIAGKIMDSKHGFWMNCLLGIIGGAVGSALSTLLRTNGGIVINVAFRIAGTVIVIALVRLVAGKKW